MKFENIYNFLEGSSYPCWSKYADQAGWLLVSHEAPNTYYWCTPNGHIIRLTVMDDKIKRWED